VNVLVACRRGEHHSFWQGWNGIISGISICLHFCTVKFSVFDARLRCKAWRQLNSGAIAPYCCRPRIALCTAYTSATQEHSVTRVILVIILVITGLGAIDGTHEIRGVPSAVGQHSLIIILLRYPHILG
jgi:hypothetical protein